MATDSNPIEYPMIKPGTLDWHGATYEVAPALIESTMLGIEDHGLFTFWLHLTFGGSGQGAGGFTLDDRPKGGDRRRGTAFGCELILRVLRTVGVESWEQLKGRRVYALRKGGWNGLIKGLYNIDGAGEPLIFAEVAAEMLPVTS